MRKMRKKFKKIAQSLGMSEAELNQFCEETQRHFKGSRPPRSFVYNMLKKHPNSSAEDIARLISPDLQWPKMKRRKSSAAKSSRKSITRTQRNYTGFTPPDSETPEYLEPAPRPSKQTHYTPPNRVTLDKVKKCPHGIPISRVCAICNPEDFRRETGID